MIKTAKVISGSIITAAFLSSNFTALSAEAKKEKPQLWTIIHAGTLLHDARKSPWSERSIIVLGKKIIAVRKGYISAADIKVKSFKKTDKTVIVDLKSKFVMAGMIDSHTHITGEMSANGRLKAVTLSESHGAVESVLYAKRTVLAGFTTIRNVGGPRNAVNALRDGISKGFVVGPRILTAGKTISPLGGHGDNNGFHDKIFSKPHSGICNGADDCRRAVREQIKYGADVIKYVATGGVLSKTATGTGMQFTQAEQNAIVETAHSMGRKVAAHAHGKLGIEAALKAGVDSIEHGSYLDKKTIKLFKKTGAYLVPTLLAGKTVVTLANKPGFFIPAVAAKARAVGPVMKNAINMAYKSGVKIAFGTDSGVSKHGTNGEELLLMMQAGISAKDVLIFATINAADLAGLSNVIGTIEAGKEADIIAANKNPLQDMQTLLKPTFVMARGKIIK
jgi:imidazolonepropionase-like amidohydrolase